MSNVRQYPMSGVKDVTRTIWTVRAERLLEQALSEVRTGTQDPIPTISAALAALKVEYGELAAGDMDSYPFPDEDGEGSLELCTCPPDLVARGGFQSSCIAVHGTEVGA